MMKKILVLVACLMLANTASAGILLEPYLGYEMATFGATTTSGSDASGKGTMMDFGARIGYHTMTGLWFAVDALVGSGGTLTFDSGGADEKYARTQIYADIGFDFPALLRAWAGVSVSNKMTNTPNSGSDVELSGGSGFKVGLGFKIIPLLTLGVEYHSNTYADLTVGSFSGSVDDAFKNFDDTATMVTLSMPFTF